MDIYAMQNKKKKKKKQQCRTYQKMAQRMQPMAATPPFKEMDTLLGVATL